MLLNNPREILHEFGLLKELGYVPKLVFHIMAPKEPMAQLEKVLEVVEKECPLGFKLSAPHWIRKALFEEYNSCIYNSQAGHLVLVTPYCDLHKSPDSYWHFEPI